MREALWTAAAKLPLWVLANAVVSPVSDSGERVKAVAAATPAKAAASRPQSKVPSAQSFDSLFLFGLFSVPSVSPW
jgi:hypothetical protein